MPQAKDKYLCDFRGCCKEADPEICFQHADRKVSRFCCDEHKWLWGGWENPKDKEKTDARMY